MLLFSFLILTSCASSGIVKTYYPDEYGNITITEKLGVDIINRDYSTVTLVHCSNVEIVNCHIENLVLVKCFNVDIIGTIFDGVGIAITVDNCLSITIKDCDFPGDYGTYISDTKSVDIDVE